MVVLALACVAGARGQQAAAAAGSSADGTRTGSAARREALRATSGAASSGKGWGVSGASSTASGQWGGSGGASWTAGSSGWGAGGASWTAGAGGFGAGSGQGGSVSAGQGVRPVSKVRAAGGGFSWAGSAHAYGLAGKTVQARHSLRSDTARGSSLGYGLSRPGMKAGRAGRSPGFGNGASGIGHQIGKGLQGHVMQRPGIGFSGTRRSLKAGSFGAPKAGGFGAHKAGSMGNVFGSNKKARNSRSDELNLTSPLKVRVDIQPLSSGTGLRNQP